MLLRNLANQDLKEDWPLLGAKLPGGLRVQVAIPPATEAGKISLTVRRPMSKVMPMPEIIAGGAFEFTRCEHQEHHSVLWREDRLRTERQRLRN